MALPVKHHSILTTVFPRLPFARRSISQILECLKVGLGSIPAGAHLLKPCIGTLIKEADDQSYVFVKDILPEVQVLGKRVRCHLSYEEVPVLAEVLVEAENPAIVQITLNLRHLDGGVTEFEGSDLSLPTGSKLDEVNQRGLLFKRLWDILLLPKVTSIDFQIMLVVAAGESENADIAAERRERVAREFTTGYRRFVSLLIQLISCAAYDSQFKVGRALPMALRDVSISCHVVQSGLTSQLSELHSTKEDAWRLLCTFHSVEVTAKKINKAVFSSGEITYVLGLQDFVASLCVHGDSASDDDFTAVRMINYLFNEKGIKREIALRKILEYYIYEALPNLP
ncbi:MAG TPA: hypothetical protein DDZ88_06185 [Verrucomicrobiales bacterium]|nr:hypothetical protein [Verrucomicrobiales bacterium]